MTRRPLRKRWLLVLGVSLSAVLLLGGFGVWLYFNLAGSPPLWLRGVSLALGGLGALILFVAGILQGLAAWRELRRREMPPPYVPEALPVSPEGLRSLPVPAYAPLPLPDPESVPDPGPLPPGSHIPFQRNVLFTGRVGPLQALARALLGGDGRSALVTQALAGMGGVGPVPFRSR